MPSDGLKPFRIRQASSGSRKPAPGPDIEAKILDAAEFVFGHFGFRGATTALIAKKAAIAKPHIYYYFEDKEDLYRAILERAMGMWARELETLDTAADIQTILTRYIHKKVDFSRDHPDLSRLYANEVISGATFIGSFIEKVSTPLLLEKVTTVRGLGGERLNSSGQRRRPVLLHLGHDAILCRFCEPDDDHEAQEGSGRRRLRHRQSNHCATGLGWAWPER